MKKYAFLSLIVACGSVILNAQAPLPTKTVPELETLSLRSAEARKLQDDLKKATMEFMAAPESAEAENAFVQAQKAVFAYQKQQAEARKKYLEENKEQKQAEARLRESEKKLEEAKKAFRDNPEQQSARQNFVQAQKDVFAARKTFRPLILVDGKERADLQDIDHKNIKSVSVLKNPKDIAPYGEKGKNGVIRIVTNQETTNKETMEQLRLRYLCRAANLKDQQRTAFEKAYKSCSEQIEALRNENATLSQTAT